MPYKHRKDIIDHKQKVSANLFLFITELYARQATHDNDKIAEDAIFYPYEKYNNDLRKLPFGSGAYRQLMQNELAEASFLHAQNRHHFYSKANQQEIDVNLIDLIEYIVDIKSSIERDPTLSNREVLNQLTNAIQPTIASLSLETIIQNTIHHIFQKDGTHHD